MLLQSLMWFIAVWEKRHSGSFSAQHNPHFVEGNHTFWYTHVIWLYLYLKVHWRIKAAILSGYTSIVHLHRRKRQRILFLFRRTSVTGQCRFSSPFWHRYNQEIKKANQNKQEQSPPVWDSQTVKLYVSKTWKCVAVWRKETIWVAVSDEDFIHIMNNY